MRLPSERVLRSWWTYLSLTLASALIGHLVFDALDDGLLTVIARPIHLLYVLVVLGAFAMAARDVYGYRVSERRRRIALMHGALRDRRTPLTVSLFAQVAIAGTTLLFEGSIIDGPHLTVSALCGLLALLVGAFALRRVESGILRLAVAAFAARRPRARIRRRADSRFRVAIAHELTYCLFRPNRPPPLFA